MKENVDKICILFVTNRCNLNCTYCYEKFKNAKRMNLHTAQQILTREIEEFQSENTDGTLQIVFMGGEPLLNFDLIRDTSEWLWAKFPHAPFSLETRTNGTCLTSESMDWFGKNRNHFQVGLSLDGTEALQNLNRSGSGGRIPIDFFTNNWPSFPVNATISPEGVKYIAESAIYFHKHNIPFRFSIAGGVEWNEDSPEQFSEQLSILIDYYLAHPGIVPSSSLFVSDFRELSNFVGPTIHTLCGKRGETVAYTADGISCICHMFTDITLGVKRFEQYRQLDTLPDIFAADSACLNCPARPFCKVCPGFNLITTNTLHRQDKRPCGMRFAILRANCILYIKRHMEQALAGKLTEQELHNMSWALRHFEALPIH